MIEIDDQTFFDEDALLDRLSTGVTDSNRQVVFVVGAPLTAPEGPDARGVADVLGVTNIIRSQFSANPSQLQLLDQQLRDTPNKYQTAFSFLRGRRGQDAANRIIRQAVSGALKGLSSNDSASAIEKMTDEELRQFDDDLEAWVLSPGVTSLGELIANNNQHFGSAVITSNFDPLVGVAIRKAGGATWKTALHTDGDLTQSEAEGCQVIHIHGYWHGSDTLHTGNQLLQKRPFLRNSFLEFLGDKTVVVMGYGGWQDIFTSSLENMVTNASAFPDVLWTFFDDTPRLGDHLKSVLKPGLDRNRVTFYSGIDCHTFLPKLVHAWSTLNKSSHPNEDSLTPTDQKPSELDARPSSDSLLPLRKLECDRPPSIDAWVGREAELRSLETSNAKTVAICGIGGQGKSVLAAKYLHAVSQGETQFVHWDWRDCKEEGDRIRTQLIAAIERISDNVLFGAKLHAATEADLIEIFVRLSIETSAVFVFDNVDHYVDLENSTFVGLLDSLVRSFSRSETKKPNFDHMPPPNILRHCFRHHPYDERT